MGCPHRPCRVRASVLAALLLPVLGGTAHGEGPAEVETTPPPAGAIGRPAAGCLVGGERLPRRGEGFEQLRSRSGRDTGHPALVAMLTDLGRAVATERLGRLRIGDLGRPNGGPLPRGHASHQNGLDADVAFALAPRRGGPALVSMVDHRRSRPRKVFGVAQRRVLELAARDPRVARIFIHPLLKRALCAGIGSEADPTWHRKLRPWWGHERHFHLRLACPPDSPLCEDQAPLPEGDGCAGLDWWFAPQSRADRDKAAGEYQQKVGTRPALPEACRAVLAP